MTSGSSPSPEPSDTFASAITQDADFAGDDVTSAPVMVAPVMVALNMPADGVPDVVVDERGVVRAATFLAAGTGPVAIDAERASGYRYGQRAYLIQIRREGSGTWLVDPIACPDLSPIADAITGVEWILHAANQDLPCLAEVGLRPTRLFDTELAGRLIGLPRVGLAAVVEHYLGLTLAKEHSAVDWSTRPLPEPWLRYAALDVEVLGQVRDLMADDLAAQDKLVWAEQEFDSLTRFTGPPVRFEPWRRTSGMHKVRNRRGAAMVRELWQTREEIAVERDISPGRVLPDAALIDLALKSPKTDADIHDGPGARSVRRYQRQLLAALERARHVPESDLPALARRPDGPPPARAWPDRDPVAAARLAQARAALAEFAQARSVPIENVLSPDSIRRVLWSPPPDPTLESVAEALLALGARQWQIDIAGPILEEAINRPVEPTVAPTRQPDAETLTAPKQPASP
ncbi:MAG: HRDC domain-containing protein [Dermatophilaceae bacterium]